MVSIVQSSRDTRATVLYNEQKLTEKKAIFLGAFNYWQEDAELNLNNKLQRLRDLTSRNERSHAHTIHFSLNYHTLQQLEDRKMRQLAKEFLGKVDFGDQPALVYRHFDAGHPHTHIVTVNIRLDGSRIDNDKRAPHYLQKVCEELEKRHDLMAAKMHVAINHMREERQYAQRLEYGNTPTKTGIETVLGHVLPNFNYTTLEELNAVLSLYRVQADRGSEYGLMYRSKGLYYRMIDDRGVKVGAPIKASSLENKPTLDYLKKKYLANQLTRQQYLKRMQDKVTIATSIGNTASLQAWKEDLSRDGIEVVSLRTPVRRKHPPIGEGRTQDPAIRPTFDGHGFYYVDFKRRAVFRDVDLGPEYTAQSILRKTGLDTQLQRLALSRKLDLQAKHRPLFEQSNPDPQQKLRLLLELSRQHDRIVAARLDRKEELRLQHRQRLSL
jgi:hypothetical protein